jgi:ABC-2 type transport system ATP-binding protein
MSAASVVLRDLRKSFHSREVLAGIDLEVAPGTVFGYLGPNGAGKTTTVKILTGMLKSFGGEAQVGGLDVRADPVAVKRIIGYVPENASLYDALEVRELLLLVGRLHDMEDTLTLERAHAMTAALGLEDRFGSRIASLSKGMRQKVLLCAGLLHDPQVLFLDEPLSGLDVASTILIKELIRALADRGKTIFYCSHMMDVVERVCDRMVILHQGNIVADGSFEELAARSEGSQLETIFSQLTGGTDARESVQAILGALQAR